MVTIPHETIIRLIHLLGVKYFMLKVSNRSHVIKAKPQLTRCYWEIQRGRMGYIVQSKHHLNKQKTHTKNMATTRLYRSPLRSKLCPKL
jgi:hypothetical protein